MWSLPPGRPCGGVDGCWVRLATEEASEPVSEAAQIWGRSCSSGSASGVAPLLPGRGDTGGPALLGSLAVASASLLAACAGLALQRSLDALAGSGPCLATEVLGAALAVRLGLAALTAASSQLSQPSWLTRGWQEAEPSQVELNRSFRQELQRLAGRNKRRRLDWAHLLSAGGCHEVPELEELPSKRSRRF